MNTFHTQLLSICLLRVLCRRWYSTGMQIGTIAKVIFGLGTRDHTCWLAEACKIPSLDGLWMYGVTVS